MNAKQRWNAEHYSRIDVALPKELVAEFKARCKDYDVSIAGEIARLLRDDLAKPSVPMKKAKPINLRFDTRLHRRKAIKNILDQLDGIKAAESAYKENIPEQLQDTNGDGIDDAVGVLECVIEELRDIEIYPPPPIRRKNTAATRQTVNVSDDYGSPQNKRGNSPSQEPPHTRK